MLADSKCNLNMINITLRSIILFANIWMKFSGQLIGGNKRRSLLMKIKIIPGKNPYRLKTNNTSMSHICDSFNQGGYGLNTLTIKT